MSKAKLVHLLTTVDRSSQRFTDLCTFLTYNVIKKTCEANTQGKLKGYLVQQRLHYLMKSTFDLDEGYVDTILNALVSKNIYNAVKRVKHPTGTQALKLYLVEPVPAEFAEYLAGIKQTEPDWADLPIPVFAFKATREHVAERQNKQANEHKPSHQPKNSKPKEESKVTHEAVQHVGGIESNPLDNDAKQ